MTVPPMGARPLHALGTVFQSATVRTTSVVLVLLVLGGGIGGPSVGRAQSTLEGGSSTSDRPSREALRTSWLPFSRVDRAAGDDRGGPRSVVLRERDVASSKSSEDEAHFLRALGGSTLGVAVGTSIGLLLWKGAAAEGLDDGERPRRGHDEPDTAEILFGAGLFALLAGGPIGAVEGAGIESRRAEAYVVGGFGELLLGGIGYGLASQLHDSPSVRLMGLGIGAAFGAAGGAALVASETERGAVAYRNGTWRVVPPDIHVRPGLASDRSPSIRVTLLSVRL